MPIYKIRDTKSGMFSHGIIAKLRPWGGRTHASHFVRFSNKGKEWTDAESIKRHLLKAMQKGVKMDTWEVVEVTYTPTKPIQDWFDAKMLVKVMK